MKRRTLLKALAAGALPTLSAAIFPRHTAMPGLVRASAGRPNILVIIVDQMREPQWFPATPQLDALLPGLARLRQGAVRFAHHYTVANACSPARACLLTGLYSHQTYCLHTITGLRIPNLEPGFPTYGTLLRALGYETTWFGKWHLATNCRLDRYGFTGGTCPSPNGLPGQGMRADPKIVDQFIGWLDSAPAEPWCTTVSLVNPHDITWYWRYTDQLDGQSAPDAYFAALPPNFETPEELRARGKPKLQDSLQRVATLVNGVMPYRGTGFPDRWLRMLDLYLLLHKYVDVEIARVLAAVEAHPRFGPNTIVLFTADHGEYAGSHGLRGKGSGVYEEGIRVPLYVRDPTGQFAQSADLPRRQLTSSVDIAPLLLTIAAGTGWREQPAYAHLADRYDLAAPLHDPDAPGRPYVVTTTDESFVEELETLPFVAPFHVIGLRNALGKLGLYCHWIPGTDSLDVATQELECYDYASERGRLELENVAAASGVLLAALYAQLHSEVLPGELRRPLPPALKKPQQAAKLAYLRTERSALYLPLV